MWSWRAKAPQIAVSGISNFTFLRSIGTVAIEQDLDLRSETRVFLNHRGGPLTRFGIRYILARCLGHASQDAPNLRKKRLHPHSVRHSTAVALLKSGTTCRRSATIWVMPA
jgi:site-specific recombinase XerD